MRKKNDLHQYQLDALEFVTLIPKSALWVNMGLGKTIVTLTMIVDLVNSLELRRVLVVAPLRVTQHVWIQEALKWEHTQHLTFNLLAGLTAKNRIEALDSNALIHVANVDIVTWLTDHPWNYDLVVLDESDAFKSHASKRFKALKKVIHQSDRVIELTGTPTPNSYHDLWSQIFLLDRGERLGKTITAFRNRWFERDYMGYTWIIRKGAAKEIKNLIADIVLTIESSDCVYLPERIDNTVEIDLPPKARKLYDQMERDFLIQVDAGKVIAANAAVKSGKLRQIATGALYVNAQRDWEEIHNAKLDALEEIFNQSGGEKFFIAYEFRSDAARIKARFPQAVDINDNPNTITQWNGGKIPLMIAHPKSAGHGLNLQEVKCTIIWFTPTWSLGLYQQFNKRIHRQGQKHTVKVHHIIAANTIDSTVIGAISRKNDSQKDLLAAFVREARDRHR